MSAISNGKYPLFDELQTFIHKYVDETCVSKDLSCSVTDAQQKLKDLKVEYYQSLLMCTALNDILVEHNAGLSYDLLFENENKDDVYHVIWNLLRSVEARNCLAMTLECNNKNADEQNVFGLSRENFVIDTPKKKLLHQSIQQILTPQVENYFKSLSLELFCALNPTNEDSEGLALAKANKLPTYVTNEEEKLKEATAALQTEETRYEETYQEYLNKIAHNLNTLEEDYLGTDKRHCTETSKVNIDWLNTKCTYILGKVRMMRNRVHQETYANDNIEALKKTHHHLTKETKETRKEIQKVKHSLEVYESVGDQFTKLLSEYTKLTNDIDLKKWALAELKSGKKSPPNST